MRHLFAAFTLALALLAAPIATAAPPAPPDPPRESLLADAGAPVHVETAPANAHAFVYLGEVDVDGTWLHASWVRFDAPANVALPHEGVEVRAVTIAARTVQGVKLRAAPSPRATEWHRLHAGTAVTIQRLHVHWGHVWGELAGAIAVLPDRVHLEGPALVETAPEFNAFIMQPMQRDGRGGGPLLCHRHGERRLLARS